MRGLNLHGSYSESYQPNLRVMLDGSTLQPLSGKQYEIGAKYVSPGRRLLLTAALFSLEENNVPEYDVTQNNIAYYIARDVAAAVVAQPLDRLGQAVHRSEAVLDGGDHQVLDVLGGDAAGRRHVPIASRSQQSSAKATRTFSPLSHAISSPSEHQRVLRWSTAIRPS